MVNARGDLTTVSILIKTGTGKTGMKGLEALHDKRVQMDINLSWQAAFKKYFNINLDKKKYCIRRKEAQAAKHRLSELIRTWLGEFQKVRASYTVQIMEIMSRKSQPGNMSLLFSSDSEPEGQQAAIRPIIQAVPRTPAPGRPVSAGPSLSTAAAAVSAAVVAAGGSGGKNKHKSSKPGPKSYKDKVDKKQKGKVKVKFPSPAKRVKREPSPAFSAASTTLRTSPAGQASASTAPRASPTKPQQDKNPRNEGAPNPNVTGAAGLPLQQGRSGLPPQRNRNSRFAEDDIDIDNVVGGEERIGNGNGVGALNDMDDDDYDARSQSSQDSQDSQDDLVELGIPNEDFKSVFIKKAMDEFTNASLLKARKDLRDLKNKERNNKWTKFTMMCPRPIAVLRALFDV